MSQPAETRRRTVVFGQVGVTLDSADPEDRWQSWRPSVSVCAFDDLLVDRYELLYSGRGEELAERLQQDLEQISPETEIRPRLLSIDDPWDLEEVYGVLHDFAASYPFEPESEDYLLHITTGSHVWQICLYLLAEAKYFPARLLRTAPPRRRSDDIIGSFDVLDLDLSRYDRIARRFAVEHEEGTAFLKQGIVTRNEAFNRLIDRIERVAIRSQEPILLTGPTGAGKSRLARCIFELRKRRRQVSGDFVEVNCATLRGDGAMSALFGHRRGAFTGAVSDRPGLLKAADGGVLFLDEIGELGADEQAMLLRAVEEGVFLPVGADREERSRFQLIAGTNVDLHRGVGDGRFREDLLARIDLWTFALPGLADRREDVEPNLDYELQRATEQLGTKTTMNREARTRFLGFATSDGASWRGNFRDLNASVVRMATLAHGGRIAESDVDEEIERLQRSWDAKSQSAGAGDPKRQEELIGELGHAADRALLVPLLGDDAVDELDRFDRVQLADVVRVCREQPTLAAAGRVLFARSRERRTTVNDADRLRKYLQRFDLDFAAINEA